MVRRNGVSENWDGGVFLLTEESLVAVRTKLFLVQRKRNKVKSGWLGVCSEISPSSVAVLSFVGMGTTSSGSRGSVKRQERKNALSSQSPSRQLKRQMSVKEDDLSFHTGLKTLPDVAHARALRPRVNNLYVLGRTNGSVGPVGPNQTVSFYESDWVLGPVTGSLEPDWFFGPFQRFSSKILFSRVRFVARRFVFAVVIVILLWAGFYRC